MAAEIHVLVAGMPPLLRDIVVNVIAAQADMILIDPPLRDRAPQRSRGEEPDVVVLAAEQAHHNGAAWWLERWPHARVIVIETSARQSILYELRPFATVMGEPSPEELAEMIRRAAKGPRAVHTAIEVRRP